jgi:large repetitive protein
MRPEGWPAAEVLESRWLLAGEILSPRALPLATAPKIPNQGVELALFDTPGPDHPASDYSATIDWGDGTAPSQGTIAVEGNWVGFIPPPSAPQVQLAVTGDHTYSQVGNYTIHVTITDKAGQSVDLTTPGEVKAEAIVVRPFPVIAYPGLSTGNVEVADFQDTVPLLHSDYTATIDWGDGTAPSVGHVQTVNFFGPVRIGPADFPTQGHQVVGEHTYAHAGTYQVHVTITSLAGDTGDESAPTTVADVSTVPGDPNGPFELATGIPILGVNVGGFDVGDPNAQPGDFTATIDWGDGTPIVPGTIIRLFHALPEASGPPGQAMTADWVPVNGNFQYPRFGVVADHAYAKAGTYTIRVSIADKAGHSATIADTAVVADETLTDGQGQSVAAGAGVPATLVPLAQFTDSYRPPVSLPGDFLVTGMPYPTDHLSAVIDWGDGTAPTIGSFGIVGVPANGPPIEGSRLVVEGTHTYAAPGDYVIHVAIASVGGAHLDVTTAATVAPPEPRVIPLTAVGAGLQGVAADITTANFLVITPTAGSGPIIAGIDWGDGSKPSVASVSVTPLAQYAYLVTVHAAHAYDKPGFYMAHVVLGPIGGPATHSQGLIVIGGDPVAQPAPAPQGPTPVAPPSPTVGPHRRNSGGHRKAPASQKAHRHP